MRLGREDAVATILVAAIVATYIAFLAAGDVPERGMAGIGLVLGSLSYMVGSRRIAGPDSWRRFLRVGGLISLGLGLVTLLTGFGGVLAVFTASIVALWALVIAAHAGVLTAGTGSGVQVERTDHDEQRPPPPAPLPRRHLRLACGRAGAGEAGLTAEPVFSSETTSIGRECRQVLSAHRPRP
jgi:hypothetical protein